MRGFGLGSHIILPADSVWIRICVSASLFLRLTRPRRWPLIRLPPPSPRARREG
ncbi:hypothetical protein SJ05684_c05710 [Sinorhizobium sojae CCBAU 05684]|uniref:Uncharacterized protein n=1 Tax=Sinorhizobium sojae CCBAU 05684 TaxID=716928 RepID=A0A249P8E8_9HYPH|nr:hypothetical protein SJ05684_c05710 [Sinorhizobium sojae CCBAU 05684]